MKPVSCRFTTVAARKDVSVPGRVPMSGTLMRDLKTAHALLCDSAVDVSRRFGFVLLVDMLNLLLHVVITAYFFISVLLLSSKELSKSKHFAVVQFLYMFADLSRMLLLVIYCSKAKNEVTSL